MTNLQLPLTTDGVPFEFGMNLYTIGTNGDIDCLDTDKAVLFYDPKDRQGWGLNMGGVWYIDTLYASPLACIRAEKDRLNREYQEIFALLDKLVEQATATLEGDE